MWHTEGVQQDTTHNTTHIMFTLIDSFNHTVISRHRTLLNAVKAKLAHIRAIERRYGPNSYLTYEITENGKRVGIDDIHDAEHQLDLLR